MAYKIAVASSDGINVDLSFGSAEEFIIYEVNGVDYNILEKRKFEAAENDVPDAVADCGDKVKNGCGSSCGSGGGCKGGSSAKVRLIADCRCIVCKKIGFNVQKQLERLAISGFDVECGVEEALNKITAYLQKIDGHQSLRGIAGKNIQTTI